MSPFYWWIQISDEFRKKSCYPPLKNVVSRQAYACWGVSRSSSVRWARRNTLFYVFSWLLHFFSHFFENVKNVRICSSNTANVCIPVYMLEIALRQKIFKISFSRIDKSDFLCRDSRTPLGLFQTLRTCFKHENSRNLVGEKIRSKMALSSKYEGCMLFLLMSVWMPWNRIDAKNLQDFIFSNREVRFSF